MKNLAIAAFCLALLALTVAGARAEVTTSPVFQAGVDSGGAGSVLRDTDALEVPDVTIINATCYNIYPDLPACVFQPGDLCIYLLCLDLQTNPEGEPEHLDSSETR